MIWGSNIYTEPLEDKFKLVSVHTSGAGVAYPPGTYSQLLVPNLSASVDVSPQQSVITSPCFSSTWTVLQGVISLGISFWVPFSTLPMQKGHSFSLA